MDTGGRFAKICGRVLKPSTHLRIVPSLGMNGATPPLFCISSWRAAGQIYICFRHPTLLLTVWWLTNSELERKWKEAIVTVSGTVHDFAWKQSETCVRVAGLCVKIWTHDLRTQGRNTNHTLAEFYHLFSYAGDSWDILKAAKHKCMFVNNLSSVF